MARYCPEGWADPMDDINHLAVFVGLLVQHNAEERTVHPQAPVVGDKPELPEFVHEKIHSRSRRADHFRQRRLADIRRHILGTVSLSEMRQHQQRPCQPLFARIKQLIHQVRLRVVVALHHVRYKKVRELVLLMQSPHHLILLNLQ